MRVGAASADKSDVKMTMADFDRWEGREGIGDELVSCMAAVVVV